MDVQTLRRLLWDLIKFNSADFIVQGTLTGYNVSARPTRTTEPTCYFALYDRTASVGQPKIGVRWGKINERQPTGFTTRGKTDAIDLDSDGTNYIYAKATLDTTTLVWESTSVIMSNVLLDNTTVNGYALLGVVETEGGRITSIVSVCENAVIAICDLAI